MKSENLKADNSAVGLQCKITVKKIRNDVQ